MWAFNLRVWQPGTVHSHNWWNSCRQSCLQDSKVATCGVVDLQFPLGQALILEKGVPASPVSNALAMRCWDMVIPQ